MTFHRILVGSLLVTSSSLFGQSMPVIGTCKPAGTPEAVLSSIAHANLKILAHTLQNGPKGNVVVSGLSLADAVSLAKIGATGGVSEELEKFLEFPPGVDCGPVALAAAWKMLRSQLLTADKSVTFTSADSAWLDKKANPKASWLAMAKRDFGATVERLVLANPTTLGKINAWAKKNTKGKVDKVLTEPLPANALFVLVNALYFAGKWSEPFDVKETKPMEFRGEKQKKEIPTMSRKGSFLYAETENAKFVALPYGTEKRFEMVLVLPKEEGSLAERKWFQRAELDQGIAAMDTAPGRVTMPKFKIDTSLPDLRATLTAYQVKKPFEFTTDWTELAPKKEVAISRIAQRVVIEVEEKGTTMAAATAVVALTRAAVMEPKPFEFKADRPFYFLLRETQSGAWLAAGAVREPQG